MAHLFILDVYVSPNRKYVNLSLIYYILDFSFFMSQDDAYFHIHQNDPAGPNTGTARNQRPVVAPLTRQLIGTGTLVLSGSKSLGI